MPSGHPCITKHKANATIHQVTAPISHQHDLQMPPEDRPMQQVTSIQDLPLPDYSSSQDIPHLDIALLNNLTTHLKGYESELDTIRTTIRDNQIESHEANVDTFTQLIECLDNLGTATAERSHPITQIPDSLTGTPSSVAMDVLSCWTWIELPTAESIANGVFDINLLPKLHRDET